MNYPEGVTGREPQIAGYPERGFDDERVCGGCGVAVEVVIDSWIDRHTVYERFTCPICGHETETDFPVEDLDDPDRYCD